MQTGRHTAVDPATWRLVTLKLPNPDGSGDIIDIWCLRSPEWLAETGAAPGGWILFGPPELGVLGPAYVVAVESCPPIDDGPGRVVLSTVRHFNGYVLRLWLEGLAEPLECTQTHPFYSVDRCDWVRAGELQVGERLRTRAGDVQVVQIQSKPGVHRVYNLEVEAEHQYYVSDLEILSHNASENPCGSDLWAKIVEHAREKHWKGWTAEQVMEKIREVLDGFQRTYDDVATGRKIYLKSDTVLIVDPHAPGGGTIFRPDEGGIEYYEWWVKKATEGMK